MDISNLLKTKEPTVKEYFDRHKDELLKLVATEHTSRTSIKDLKYEITSQSGKRYYSFPERMQIPFMRIAKGMELMDWLQNGINAEEFDRIRASIHNSLAHIKAKKDIDIHINNAGLMIAELDRRRAQALPYYVLINLCANYLIREDEDPQVISSPIHHQKCDDLQNEIETGNNAFFLTLPQLKPLSVTRSLSLSELNEYLTELNREAEKDRNIAQAYLSWTERQKGSPTSSKA